MKYNSTNIGGAWKKTSSKGTNYISGKLNNGMYFTIFANTNKQSEKHPDYRILMDTKDATTLGLLDEYTRRKQDEHKQAAKDRAEDLPF